MYLIGVPSIFDEVSWGSDAWSFTNSIYQIQDNFLTRGKITGYDLDYYQIILPYSGSFQITISNDSVNNWGAGWSIGSITAAIVNSFGVVQAGLSTTAFGVADGNLYLSWTGGYSTDYYLRIEGFSNASYVVKLKDAPVQDLTPPSVISVNPPDGSINVPVASDLVVTFNEAIQRGTGSIILKTAAGATVEMFDIATSSRLTVAGNTLTINPTADLLNGIGYVVELSSGAIKDLAGNAYVGFNGYDFTTVLDNTRPSVISVNPPDGSINVPVASDLVVTFNEAIQRGTGSIILKTAAGATVEMFDIATSSRLTVAGNTLTINPTKDFGIFTRYNVEFSAGSIKDLAGNPFVDAGQHSFTTATVDSLYHFFVVAFAAAPGVAYMDQLAEAYNYGLSVKEIVNIFTTKSQFTDVYSPLLSNHDLATQLVNNIVKSSATEQAKLDAVKDIEGALGIGWTRGDVIYTVFGNLASKPLDDSIWGHTALQFLNQTAVSRYYTEVMHAGPTDLPTLRAVVGDVTPYTDVSTPEVIATLIGVELSHIPLP